MSVFYLVFELFNCEFMRAEIWIMRAFCKIYLYEVYVQKALNGLNN